MMDGNLHKQMVFEANRKSVGIAYLLWFFLGYLGVHRLYSGRTRSGIAQLVLFFSIIGWLVLFPWLLVDIVLIPGMIREKNMQTITELTGPSQQISAEPLPSKAQPRKVVSEADRKREEMLEDLRATGYRKERRSSNLYR